MGCAKFPNNNGANVQFKLCSKVENKLLKSLALWFNRILFELHLNCTPLYSQRKKRQIEAKSNGIAAAAAAPFVSPLPF